MGTRVIAPVHVAFRTYLLRRRPGCIFSQPNSPPRLYPCLRFTVSLAVAAQDSGPSGSLLLSRKNFPFSASCRFIPAHKYLCYTHNPNVKASRGKSPVSHVYINCRLHQLSTFRG